MFYLQVQSIVKSAITWYRHWDSRNVREDLSWRIVRSATSFTIKDVSRGPLLFSNSLTEPSLWTICHLPCLLDAPWLFPPPPPFLFLLPLFVLLLSDSSCQTWCTLPPAVFCLVSLMGQSLLSPAQRPFNSPWSLYSFISLSCSTSQVHHRLFFSLALLICSAFAICLYTSHWSLSAELSITLSILPPSSPFPGVVGFHTFAVRDLFLSTACYRDIFHFRSLYQQRPERVNCIGKQLTGPTASDSSVSQLREHYLESAACTVYVLPFQSVISNNWVVQKTPRRMKEGEEEEEDPIALLLRIQIWLYNSMIVCICANLLQVPCQSK